LNPGTNVGAVGKLADTCVLSQTNAVDGFTAKATPSAITHRTIASVGCANAARLSMSSLLKDTHAVTFKYFKL
jgi:hypothetical protein